MTFQWKMAPHKQNHKSPIKQDLHLQQTIPVVRVLPVCRLMLTLLFDR